VPKVTLHQVKCQTTLDRTNVQFDEWISLKIGYLMCIIALAHFSANGEAWTPNPHFAFFLESSPQVLYVGATHHNFKIPDSMLFSSNPKVE
jgi:hypothetical protein